MARAAFRTDAVILDSGLGSGMEKFCMRKHLTLVGVAPEREVIYPRINPNVKQDNELTNGHTHFVLLGNGEGGEAAQDSSAPGRGGKGPAPKQFAWGDEAGVKFDLAKRIAAGRSKIGQGAPCKIVLVLVGDNKQCHKDVEQALNLGIPIIVLEGSPVTGAVVTLGAKAPDSPPDPSLKWLDVV